MKLRISIFVFFFLASLSCISLNSPEVLTPLAEPTRTETQSLAANTPLNTPEISPDPIEISETPASTQQEIPTPTPSPGIITVSNGSSICVQPNTHDPLIAASFNDYPDAILDFLNAGGTADELQSDLERLGITNQPITAASADLTGDGKYEIVVSYLDPESAAIPPEGTLVIYVCQGEQYELEFVQTSEEAFGAPAIIYIQDLNADSQNELIISSPSCGAHSCFEDAQILSWNGSTFEALLDGDIREMPFPDLQITDYDQDGIYNLEVVGSGFGSIGAGPQREITRIWGFDHESGHWILAEEALGPSDFRIHVLHDADEASRRGEYLVAAFLYNQVINDQELVDWMDRIGERLNLGAYGRYKMVVVYTLLGEPEAAQSWLADLKRNFPPEYLQFAYVEMAVEFLNGFNTGGQQAGCDAAHVYAAVNADRILAPLGQQKFGYANPDYSPLDICP